jgi:ADYC domain
MTMRMWMVLGAMATLVGCGRSPQRSGDRQAPADAPHVAADAPQAAADAQRDAAEARASVEAQCVARELCSGGKTTCTAEDLICPNGTTNCCPTNGTGIYTDEGGFAGIDVYRSPPVGQPPNVARKIMITNLANVTAPEPRVTFQVGYFDPTNQWLVLGDGAVGSADYADRQRLRVVAVHETNTTPVWTLIDPATHSTISVRDKQLADLVLHITFPDGWNNTVQAALDFTGPATRTKKESPGVRTYGMRWRFDVPGATAWKPYCLDAKRRADSVVFQHDIVVDPMTGAVARPSPGVAVTLSCFRGAPATVYGWGYPYTGQDVFHFDAGIQMKRASYCADSHDYTVAGTPIEIRDDLLIRRDAVRHLEASWTAHGATCVNLKNLRHSGLGFTGTCNGVALPACPADPPSSSYLIAGPQNPAP